MEVVSSRVDVGDLVIGNLRARSRALNGFSASILSPTPYGKM